MEILSNQVEMGIEVTAEVSLSNTDSCEEIRITISPDVVTLLPQVKNLMQRIYICARGMMFQKLANKSAEISASGIFPEYKHETVQAHAVVSVPGGIVTVINGNEVDFVPSDIANTVVFEYELLKQAREKLVIQLLTDFATWGGH